MENDFQDRGEDPLKDWFPGLFNLVSNVEALVADFGMRNGWIPDLEGTFLDRELIEVDSLLQLLNLFFRSELEDRLVWNIAKKASFSIKTYCLPLV